jgi:hypothetical protein
MSADFLIADVIGAFRSLSPDGAAWRLFDHPSTMKLDLRRKERERVPPVKLKATIIVAALFAATAAHADTIYLKCWAQGLTGDQRNSVYMNGEQVTVKSAQEPRQH